jgi:phosphoribosylformimino-5-aminoimidazole carboxamide ribotide isomerase
MIIYPAIDIKDRKCVRLVQGDMGRVTTFNDDIVKQAKEFYANGFRWLHMVDLDGAIRGKPVSHDIVSDVIKQTGLRVQLGGGVRSMRDIDNLIDIGVSKVILGTIAITNFNLLKDACKKYPGQIIVGVDVRNNHVSIKGWVEESEVLAFDLIKKLENIGVTEIIYTDINRDGLLHGFDEMGVKELLKDISIPMIISGGVTSIEDLRKIKKMAKCGVSGVIVGRALYEKAISYEEISLLKIGQ